MWRFGNGLWIGIWVFGAIVASNAGSLRAEQTYLLRYKLQAGERVISTVYHESETQTMIAGVREDSHSRTSSVKVWNVSSVDSSGNMTFVYWIDQVKMSQTIGEDRFEYDSLKDSQAPDVFATIAQNIGKPLATVTIDSTGELLERDRDFRVPQLGMGELTVPLPKESIAVGAEWQVSRELRLKKDNGRFKLIKVRELYRLEKVSAGVATISIQTQPLTPIADPALEAQLIQQLSKGTIKFDIDTGRLISKRLDWGENVLGFRGPDSSMRYDATWQEELLPANTQLASAKILSK
jgi:hypothetical protein